MEQFHEKLKQLRIERGASQNDVAAALGLTRNAITNYENGYREPSLEILRKLCEYYDVSADYLIGISDYY